MVLDIKQNLQILNNSLELRILLDRTSLEVFADNGKLPMSFVVYPANDKTISMCSENGTVKVDSVKIHQIDSIWKDQQKRIESADISPDITNAK